MSTSKDLESQVSQLTARVNRLKESNSELRDEVFTLKSRYDTLVKEVSDRLEAIHTRFQSSPVREAQ